MAAEAALNLIPKQPDLMDKISPVVVDAQSLQIATREDVDLARSKGKIINALISEVEATFKPIKQAQDAAKKATLEQEKKHLAPLQEAKNILSSKITAWDTAERNRIAEEQRIAAQEAERKRQAALKAAENKLESLMSGMTENQGLLKTLENMLNNPETSDEEAEVIRAKIRTTQAKIDSTVERAQMIEQKVEEVSQPMGAVRNVADVKTATGVSQEKVITGIRTMLLIKYLASEGCNLDPESLIEWNGPQIKKLINSGVNLPGVSWEYRSKARF